jgi:hypothetical protein
MDTTAYRSFSAVLVREKADEAARTVELSFSSEAPVMRGGWKEVLSHADGAMVLDRLNNGGPLLLHHDDEDQIGVVEKAWIEDGKGRAIVRFSKSKRGEEVFQDVLDGIRRNVSVGYAIDAYEEDTENKVFTATRWEPFEISLVPIPADNSVGVNRATAVDIARRDMRDELNKNARETEEELEDKAKKSKKESEEDTEKPEGDRKLARSLEETAKANRETAEATRKAMELAERQGVNIDALASRIKPDAGENLSPLEKVSRAAAELKLGGRANIDLDYRAVASIGGFSLTSFDRPGVVRPFDSQVVKIADIVPVYSTSASTIREIVEKSAVTPGASETDESGTKPDQTFDFEERDFPVETIAAVVVVTQQLLEDQGAVASYIQNRLPLSVRQRLDSQIVNGSGIGTPRQLKGILATSGIQSQAFSVSKPDSILAGITKVEKFGSKVVDAVLLNPADWASIRGERSTDDDHYIAGSWAINLPPTIWGKPVVTSSFVPQGTAIVGAFGQSVGLHIRKGVTLDITDKDWDLMKLNHVGIRAEMRAAFVVHSPFGICEVALTQGS